MLGTRYYTPLLSAQAVYKLWEATTNTTTTATGKDNKCHSVYLPFMTLTVYVMQDTDHNHIFFLLTETLLPCAH